jgi:hypothetical protein
MGSFSARRLARTEITRAHGVATIEVAKRTPFALGVKWSLSGRHPKSDPCDENARRDEYRLGPGIYPPEKVPQYPSHAMCLCTLSTATESDVDSVVQSLREQYGLGTGAEPEAGPSTVPTFGSKLEAKDFIESLGTMFTGGPVGDLRVFQTVAEGLAREVNAGKSIPPEIRFFQGTAQDGVASFTFGVDTRSMQFINHRMNINVKSNYWDDPAGDVQFQHDAGFWSTNDPLAPIAHENGHWLHYQNAPPPDVVAPRSFVADGVTYPGFTWAGKDIPSGAQAIAAKVSRYAATMPKEFVAETYTGLRAGRSYDEDVMDLYRLFGGPDS